MASLTTVSSILKEFYVGPIVDQLNQEIFAVKFFESVTVDWMGKKAIFPISIGRNSGIGFSSSGTLPGAGSQSYDDLQVTANKLYGRFSIENDAMAAGKAGSGSFVNVLDTEMTGLTKDVKKYANTSCFSGGRVAGWINQRKAEVGAADWEFSGDTSKVQAALTAKAAAVAVQVIRMDTLAVVATVNVNSVDATAGTINLDALDTAAALTSGSGTPCAIKISDADASLTYLDGEATGIYGNMSEPTHFSVDRTSATGSATSVQAVARTASTAATQARTALTLDMIQGMFDAVTEASDGKPDMLALHPSQRQKYVALLQGQLRTQMGSGAKADGGFSGGLSYSGIALEESSDCGRGMILALSKKTWKLAELQKIGFADYDGNVLSRIPGKDSVEGYVRWYYETLCVAPAQNAVLVGLTL